MWGFWYPTARPNVFVLIQVNIRTCILKVRLERFEFNLLQEYSLNKQEEYEAFIEGKENTLDHLSAGESIVILGFFNEPFGDDPGSWEGLIVRLVGEHHIH